jgi:hypothetical protein
MGEVANDFGGLCERVEPAGVGGGDFEAEEESVGALHIDEITGQGVDDFG